MWKVKNQYHYDIINDNWLWYPNFHTKTILVLWYQNFWYQNDPIPMVSKFSHGTQEIFFIVFFVFFLKCANFQPIYKVCTYCACYSTESFDANNVSSRTQRQNNHTYVKWGFNVVQLTMPTSTDEREWFYCTIENITEDKTRYNYWVSETSHVSPILVSIPYYEPSRSTEYLPFFLTSLYTSYSLYRSISIS